MYTTTDAFLDALTEAGVSYMFANFGSDHPALVEALAKAEVTGRPTPKVITSPNEMVALSAAQGFYQASGVAQAVVVHVECGTQALAGAVHNAAKGRAPVLIFAGASPFTQYGELAGSRNEFIQWIQDVHDQRGLVRGYMRYDNEIRTGANVKQLVHRALKFAYSDPKGPVYLMGAREVMEAEAPPAEARPADWAPVEPIGLTADGAARIGEALLTAERPLVVTSYLGKSAAAVEELTRLCRRLGVGVIESVPNAVNFPQNDPLYLGNYWNHPVQQEALAAADVILVIETDVPWIPAVNRPTDQARIFQVDADPLKEQMPLWHIPAEASFRADAATALADLNHYLDRHPIEADAVAARQAAWAGLSSRRLVRLDALEAPPPSGQVTSEYFLSRMRRHIDDDTLVLSESISHYHTVIDHLRLTRPGSLLSSGGGSLGWIGGAAIGAKLARPDSTVISFMGDGTYMFTVPSSVHWMARRYDTPFLQVIFNNRGWKSPKLSALALHPDGYAARAERLDVSFEPPPDYAGIAAAAGGALALSVSRADEVDDVIQRALAAVREERRCAVIEICLPHL